MYIEYREIQCAICNSKVEKPVVLSCMQLGLPDLDSRPAETARSNIGQFVRTCPVCKYTTADLGIKIAGADSVLNRKEYFETLYDVAYPGIANKYRCEAMLYENANQFGEAGWSYLSAAWVCDDEQFDKGSVQCRVDAVNMFLESRRAGLGFAALGGYEDNLIVDLLRVAKKFEQAKQYATEALSKPLTPIVELILDIQLQLIDERDCKVWSVDQIDGMDDLDDEPWVYLENYGEMDIPNEKVTPDRFHIECPHCSGSLMIEKRLIESPITRVRCSNCQGIFGGLLPGFDPNARL